MILWVQIFFNCRDLNFFFYQDFVSRKLATYRTAGEGRGHLLFHHTTSTCSRTFRHLCGTLYVRWLSHIFNRITCVYQTATRWDLPPYRVTIWLIEVMLIFVCLLVKLILGFVQLYDMRNRWARARIDYHPCIESEPTNQVCYSPQILKEK